MNHLELPSPADMSPAARAAEITTILASAIVRSRVATKPNQRDIELGFLPHQRVHTTPSPQEPL